MWAAVAPGMKLNSIAVGTMRNIIIQSSTRQVVGPLEPQTLQLGKDIRPEYRSFVKDAMGKDTFDLVELDRRLSRIVGLIEAADGKGLFNLNDGKFNRREIAEAARSDRAVLGFVALVQASPKLL